MNAKPAMKNAKFKIIKDNNEVRVFLPLDVKPEQVVKAANMHNDLVEKLTNLLTYCPAEMPRPFSTSYRNALKEAKAILTQAKQP